ncbi:MAG: mechanosensitive ion channel family protein [Bdellovibrionaceae bacterium]|nr:mechanosensitive ion channel family protein [Bdellovibrio sp.]
MKDVGLNIQAGTQFISSEMQEISERVVFLIPNWKWVALLGGLFLLYLLRHLVVAGLQRVKNSKPFFLQNSFMHFFMALEVEKSLSWMIVSMLGIVLAESLQLPLNMNDYLTILLKLIFSLGLFRLCYLAAEGFGLKIKSWAAQEDTLMDDQLAPLATKTLKVVVIIFGIIMILKNFRVDVTTVLAGLGIGGVALAFAAKDTVENVFGTITILLDKPFKIGDRVKMGDTEGYVEEVGFRSTRIRTLYNSLVILPNSIAAKEKVDNLSDRNGWLRFRHVLGFTYDTNMATLNQLAEHLKFLLLQDTKVDRDRISITLSGFGSSSLEMVIAFHYHVSHDDEESPRVQTYLQMIHAITQQLKMEFAYSTQTMIMQTKVQPQIQAPTPAQN